MMRELILRDLSLWECLWQSVVFLALGLAAGWWLRRRPSRAYAALLVAMMATALVPFLTAAVRHGHLGVFPATAEESAEVLLPPPALLAQKPAATPPATDVSRPVTDPGPERSLSVPGGIPWRAILLSAWLAATLLLVARLVATFVYGDRLIRQAQRSGCEEIQQATERTASRLRLATGLQIRASDRIHSPVVWCWTHPPVLLIPRAPGQPALEWTGVVAHELAHCRRRDHLTGLIAELMASLLPWNPLMWLARRFLIRLGEQACDDWVVASGQSSEDYAEALLRFRPQKQMAFWPAVVSSRTGLSHRVRRILGDACGNPCAGVRWALALGVVVLCIALGVAFAQTRPVLSEAPAQPPGKPAPSLHQAAADGNLEQVQKLIAQGADVNAKDEGGWTPLHSAAWSGRKEVAEVLLAQGAKIDEIERSGQTPLHLAVGFGSRSVPELLLAKGASINARDKAGNTPLHIAASARGGNLLELLIAKGADVKASNEEGRTPLHSAAAATGRRKRDDLVESLLANGADIHAKDKRGCTPLHTAAGGGRRSTIELLLGKGADIKVKAADGTTPLHWAMMGGHAEAVEFLLSRGAQVNDARSDGRTALHHTAGTGNNTLVDILISKGADVNAKDVRGDTPASVAVTRNRKGTVNLLISKGAEVATVQLAAYLGELDRVKSYLEKGISVDARDGCQLTPLHAAAGAGQRQIAEFLINQGASVNAGVVAEGPGTPLHYAIDGGSREVAELLINKGARVNDGSKSGLTPLHLAARGNNKDLVKFLLASKADVDAKDPQGETALHYAARNKNKDIAQLLIEYDADINRVSERRKETPLVCAARSGSREVIQLLIHKGAALSDIDVLLYCMCMHGYKDLAELFIQKGANVNSKAWGDDDAPALEALWSGYPNATEPRDVLKLSMLKLLLDHGANPNAKDRWDWSLLHYAGGNVDLTRLLLDKGANPDIRENEEGATPLHFAADTGRKAVAELLLSRGADANARDYSGRNPLSYAEGVGDENMSGQPRQTPLTAEAKAAKNEIAEILRKHGAKE